MGQNSCQPEGLQPESAMAALLVLAIERLLPSPSALPSPILTATHTCFIKLGALIPTGRMEAGRDARIPISLLVRQRWVQARQGHDVHHHDRADRFRVRRLAPCAAS